MPPSSTKGAGFLANPSIVQESFFPFYPLLVLPFDLMYHGNLGSDSSTELQHIIVSGRTVLLCALDDTISVI